jgi:hypothetical protein
MKAINHNLRSGESLVEGGIHAVRKVRRHFPNLPSVFLRDTFEYSRDILTFGAPNPGRNTAFATKTVPVA